MVYLVCSVCLVYLVEPDQLDKPNKPDRPRTKCAVEAPSGVEPLSHALRIAVRHNPPVYFVISYDSHSLHARKADQMYYKALAIHCAEARYVSQTRRCRNRHLTAPSLHSDKQGRRSRLPLLRTARQTCALCRLPTPERRWVHHHGLSDRPHQERNHGL
jgi:hypothetical protein